MFYPVDEFEYQIQELVEQGYSRLEAYDIVREQEHADEMEYNELMDQREAADSFEARHDEPYEPEINDDWYDNQYEIDTDYF